MKPGRSERPRSSTTRVFGPLRGLTSSSRPTATMRSSSTATACAISSVALTVWTLPPRKIRSALMARTLSARRRGLTVLRRDEPGDLRPAQLLEVGRRVDLLALLVFGAERVVHELDHVAVRVVNVGVVLARVLSPSVMWIRAAD